MELPEGQLGSVGSLRISRGHWDSVRVSGAQCRSVGISGSQWEPVGLIGISGILGSMYLHHNRFPKNICRFDKFFHNDVDHSLKHFQI